MTILYYQLRNPAFPGNQLFSLKSTQPTGFLNQGKNITMVLWVNELWLDLKQRLLLLNIFIAWVSGWLFVSNKRQNSWTDQAQILCVRPHMILGTKISKISIQQNSIFLNFENPRIFLCKIPELYLLLFYNVYKKIKMFTIELKDGLEAP